MALRQEEVFRVASELQDAGLPVTYTAVRERLKTGSFGTIGRYLKLWKEQGDEARQGAVADEVAVHDLPEYFQQLGVRVAREAWLTARGEVATQVQALRVAAEEEIASARKEAELAASTVDELQATLDRVTSELTQVREELGRTKELVAHGEGEQVRLEAIIIEQREAIKSRDTELGNVRELLTRNEAALEFTKRDLQGTQTRAEELKSERDEARTDLGRVRAENEELKNRAASLFGELKESQAEKKRLSEELEEELQEKEAIEETLEREKEAHRGTRNEFEGQLAELAGQVKSLGDLRMNDRETLERALLQNKELSDKVEALNERLQDVLADRATLTERLRVLSETTTTKGESSK